MHKVLIRIDEKLYREIQKWVYLQKSEGREMSFNKFVTGCIMGACVKNGIKNGGDDGEGIRRPEVQDTVENVS